MYAPVVEMVRERLVRDWTFKEAAPFEQMMRIIRRGEEGRRREQDDD